MTEKQKIKRWDLVDGAIYNLILELNPSDKPITLDQMPLNDIRIVLIDLYVKKLKLCTEYQFYP